MKKFVSMFLALVMCLTLAAPAWAAENDPYLEKVKKSYIDGHCFYQITDTEYLDSLADDEIIEVFHCINVTKRLLNENMILDINKVTSNDIVKGSSLQRMTIFETDTANTLSSIHDNAVVIKKGVVQQGLQYAGTTVYLTYMYLSNQGIVDFVMSDWTGSLGKTLKETIYEWALCTLLDVATQNYGTFLSLAISFLDDIKASKEMAFREQLCDLYYAGDKAILCITPISRSCEEWKDNIFYTENGSRSGMDITSEYNCYNNKPVGK